MSAAALELDFHALPHAHWRHAGWLALALASALCVGMVVLQHGASGVTQDLQVHNDQLQSRLRPARNRAPVVLDATSARQLQRANAVIDQLTLPWDDLFAAFEKADARKMGLLSLAPNLQDRSLRLTGEARSLSELLAYVDRLSAQPQLARVHLLGYETVNRDGSSVISFTLSALWKSP